MPNNIQKVNYLVLNARISYEINKCLNVYLSGNNLLNSEYEINYGYPMPGINFSGGINFKFRKDL